MNYKDIDWYKDIDYMDESIFRNQELLKARGEYLVEVIDKTPDIATYKDIEELENVGTKVAVPWGCGSGKTTAMRQFVVHKVLNGGFFETGVVSTKLKIDVNRLYFDILSHIVYLEGNTSKAELVQKFIGLDVLEISSLTNAKWIICTHERLMIEPPSVLYRFANIDIINSINLSGSGVDLSKLYRKYLLIDEYPSSLFKRLEVSKLMYVDLLNKSILSSGMDIANEIEMDIARGRFIDKAYRDSVSKIKGNKLDNVFNESLVSNIPTPYNYNYTTDISKNYDNSDVLDISKLKLTFFTNYFAKKLAECAKTEKYPEYLYYSISDLTVQNTYIFDGTSDILFKDSELYKISSNRKLSPTINEIYRIPTSLNRKHTTEDISDEYSSMLNMICKDNPDSSILAYTWKSSKSGEGDDSELLDAIQSKLDEPSRVKFITYQSGKERVTSEFTDCDVMVILGKFAIPNNVIYEINDILQTNLSQSGYTESLLVQAIYRTCVRKKKPLHRLYITEDYSISQVSSLLDNLKCTNNPSIFDLEYESILQTRVKDKDLYQKILDNLDESQEISVSKLSEILGIDTKDSYYIKRKLDSLNITYSYSRGQGNKHFKLESKFKIY